MREALEVRFWAKVDRSQPEGCWLWTATRSRGYGRFSVGGRLVRAHRFAWELTQGPVTNGLHVLHRCDTPACVNPSHLFLGTPMDNAHDRDAKGRQRTPKGEDHYLRIRSRLNPRPKPPLRGRARGERGGNAKLTEADVRAIRDARARGESQATLSKRYGVGQTTVSAIVRGRIWRHVEVAA